jgi:chemotaxis signal transduction protein
MNYFVKFEINNVALAAPIQEVKEIARPKVVLTRGKNARNLAGFFKLRGKNVPLFDLPRLFDSRGSGRFEVIVSDINKVLIGFKVDSVSGVLAADAVNPVPALASTARFMQGIIQEGEHIVQVLSLKKLMSGPRLRSVKKYV